ncbi:MAG: helix-turn-helix transcriptional regulator, partial [Caldilineaceae bacterium]|nr:helix-turn-helix transcriptional regulator [Caldilineaceae bacterium]
ANTQPYRVRTISEFHQLRGLPKPAHPLVSVVNLAELEHACVTESTATILDFYSISIKRCLGGKFKYGQQEYDFDEGVMFFIAPGQVFAVEAELQAAASFSGWVLAIHPDFLWNTPLAKTIKRYEYFDYSVNEALFLSEKEETTIINLFQTIQQEYQSNIDAFSQSIIIAQIELLLTYCERFYQRQFITRKIANHQILDRLEALLDDYFDSVDLLEKGLPTVHAIAEALAVSPNYLSGLLKVLTGQSTQQHIHDKVIAKAKERLSTTELSVSEIAYELGFQHAQSFSKLFKSKTDLSPLEFRRSFN